LTKDTTKPLDNEPEIMFESAADKRLRERLGQLDTGLTQRRNKVKQTSFTPTTKFGPDMAKALSLGTEFMGAILLGGALGLGFDYVVNSRPLGLILFLLLGFAAGVLIVIRGASRLTTQSNTTIEQISPETTGKDQKAE